VLVEESVPPCSRHTDAGPVAARLPLPYDLVTDCVANNNQAVLLLPDNRTLVQVFVAPALVFTSADSLVVPDVLPPEARWSLRCMVSRGSPQPFPWEINVLGDEMYGAHGGSGLSAMGGSIRKGELLPATGAIAHALKVELWAHRLAPC
jgi:hypothetical protein